MSAASSTDEENTNPNLDAAQPSGVYALLVRFDDLSVVALEHRDEMPPVFSPSGRSLAYVKEGSIVQHELNSGDEKILVQGSDAKSPLWWLLPE